MTASTTLEGDPHLPLFRKLAQSIRNQIVQGDWGPGDKIPSENEFSDRYGLAPGTVRQALSTLVEERLLERIHGKGTFVRRPNFSGSLISRFRFDLEKRTVRLISKSVVNAPKYVADKLHLEPGTLTIRLYRQHLDSEMKKPVMLDEIWLPYGRFQALMEFKDEAFGLKIYELYREECDSIAFDATEVLSAETVPSEAVSLLDVQRDAAVVRIDRVTRAVDGSVLEWRRVWGNAKGFHFEWRIS